MATSNVFPSTQAQESRHRGPATPGAQGVQKPWLHSPWAPLTPPFSSGKGSDVSHFTLY